MEIKKINGHFKCVVYFFLAISRILGITFFLRYSIHRLGPTWPSDESGIFFTVCQTFNIVQNK